MRSPFVYPSSGQNTLSRFDSLNSRFGRGRSCRGAMGPAAPGGGRGAFAEEDGSVRGDEGSVEASPGGFGRRRLPAVGSPRRLARDFVSPFARPASPPGGSSMLPSSLSNAPL